MANNQEMRDEDFSQDVKDDQDVHLNGEEATGENGTENGNSNGNDNDNAGENGQGEAAGRDDDRLV